MSVIIYTDGGARNNPGPAAIGAVILQGEKVVSEIKKYIGSQTNNYAEYEAVFCALSEAHRLGFQKEIVEVRLDSQLVKEQLSGNYKIKEPTLKEQFKKVKSVLDKGFSKITFVYIPREKNKEADRLVNEALDEYLKV